MTSPKGRTPVTRAAGFCILALLAGGAGGPAGPIPAHAQEAASAVQDVTLQDLVLPLGETVLKASRVTVNGTRLSKDDLLALLAPAGDALPARLARLDAASLSIPELRVERASGGGRQTVTYRDVLARDVRGGRIAELTASGAALAVERGDRKGVGTYGAIQATALDLTALARLYGEPGDGKGPLQRIYGAIAIAEVAYVDERGTAVKLARIEGRDLSGRTVPATWTGALQAFSGPGKTPPGPADRARLAGLAADLAEGVSVGALEATGLSIQETRGPEPWTVAIGRLRYAGADGSLEDVSFAGGGVGGRIASLSLTGFSLAPTIAALRTLSAAASEPSDEDLRRLAPAIGTLGLKDMSLDLAGEPRPPQDRPGPDAARDPLAARTAATHIGLRDAAMRFGPPRDGVPTGGRATVSGLTLPAAAVAGVPGLGSLAAYGYGDLDLDLVADSAWDEASRELRLREVAVSGKDMGTLRLNGTFGGIGPEVFDPDAGVSGFAMLSATAKALDLTIENTGLFERFIAAQSKALSLKPEELKQEYVTASVFGVPAILGNSAGAKAIGAAMGQFVARPGTLSLSAKAKNAAGIGMVEFSASPTPAAVLDRLEVNAKAN